MRLKGDIRQEVYDVFEEVYRDVTNCSFSWKSGEKTLVRKGTFQRVSEFLEIRDPERFDEVKEVYRAYLEDQVSDWFSWERGRRDNLMGFVNKRENIELFVNRYQADLNEGSKAEEKDIAGTQSNDDWEW